MKYGMFYDLTGKGDFRQASQFPTFTEKNIAELYLDKFVNNTGITSFIIMELKLD